MPGQTLYIFLGRRGAISRWLLDIAIVTRGRAAIAVSRQNELYEEIRATGANLLSIDTFRTTWGALLLLPHIFSIRRAICDFIIENNISRVVVLMPHIWTPLLAKAIRKCGAEYIVVIHDASPHPGDYSARIHWWLMRDAFRAHRIIVLSQYVFNEISKNYPKLKARIAPPLFLPLLGAVNPTSSLVPKRQLKFLFFGRIMPYKGLPLFITACEILRQEQLQFDIAVVGEGPLKQFRDRLKNINAQIDNRWIDDNEISSIFQRCDAVVLTNTEASQSGVVPVAFAAGRPVIATPIGGISSQVEDGYNGLLTENVSAHAVADAMRRMIENPALYTILAQGVRQTQDQISTAQFLVALESLLDRGPSRKVLIVTRCLDIGGTEMHLVRILPELLRAGIDISLFALERGGQLEPTLVAHGVSVFGPPRARSHWRRVVQASTQLFHHLRRTRPDILHFFLAEPYLIGSAVSILVRVRTRIMSRRSLAQYHLRHPILGYFETFLHWHTHAILGNSTAVIRDLFLECQDHAKIGLLYNGVDIPTQTIGKGRTEIRRSLGIESSCFVMAIIANLVPYKGHEDLIIALSIAKPRLTQKWRLLLIGRDDGIGTLLRSQAKSLGIDDDILWLGEVKQAADLLGASDLVILASHEEGFSNSLLEAMAHSLPVIATAVGGNLDAVVPNETGVLVPAKSPKALADAIIELAANPALRTKLGNAARCRVDTHFKIDNCIQQYIRLYESVDDIGTVPVQSILDKAAVPISRR